MQISGILNNVAAGSTTATPSTGSAAADYVSKFPAQAIKAVAGLFGTIGS